MKSIRRFRLTRQALKQAPELQTRGNSDEELEFPLGPRLFRKKDNSPVEPDHSVIIGKRNAPEDPIVTEQDSQSPESGNDEQVPSDSGVLKIIRRLEDVPEERRTEPAGEDAASPEPAVVQSHDPSPPAPDGISEAESPAIQPEEKAERTPRRKKSPAAGTASDRLSRYAIEVDRQSYVLIDDDGRPVTRQDRRNQK